MGWFDWLYSVNVDSEVWDQANKYLGNVQQLVTHSTQQLTAIVNQSKQAGSDLILLGAATADQVLEKQEKRGIRLIDHVAHTSQRVADRVILLSAQRYNEVLQSLVKSGGDTAIHVVDHVAWRLNDTSGKIIDDGLQAYTKALQLTLTGVSFTALHLLQEFEQTIKRLINHFFFHTTALAIAIAILLYLFSFGGNPLAFFTPLMPHSPFEWLLTLICSILCPLCFYLTRLVVTLNSCQQKTQEEMFAISTQLNKLVATNESTSLPVGSIVCWSGEIVPPGYIELPQSELSYLSHGARPRLEGVIGTRFDHYKQAIQLPKPGSKDVKWIIKAD